MDRNTPKTPGQMVDDFLGSRGEHIGLVGKWSFEITRANGDVEKHEIKNTMNYVGLNLIATRLTSNAANSAWLYLSIGTATAQPDLDTTDFGEVSRKIAATAASSHEVAILVATWAGDADGIAGVALGSGASVNHADSGQGVLLNIVNSVSTTLQDSDFLKVQMEVQVGSHALP